MARLHGPNSYGRDTWEGQNGSWSKMEFCVGYRGLTTNLQNFGNPLVRVYSF
jgi:hypothetical protein